VKTKSILLLLTVLAAGTMAFAQFDMFKKALDAVKGGVPAKTNSATTNDTVNSGLQLLRGAAGIGPEEEKTIGDSVAVEIVGKYGGLVRDATILHRVNLVGRALARYSDRPDLTWRFGVLNSDSVNAFSAPDGWVFISRGLYALAKDDDELAGILGHEIAHITGRHALKIVEKSNMVGGLVNGAVSRSGDARALNEQLQQFDLGIGKIATTLFEKGYSPETEYEADKIGHNLAGVTGYAPGGLRAALVQLQQRGGDPKKTFSTHPPLKDRIQRLPDEPAPK
jgi:predicted Zn-dependent protease